MDRSSGIVYEPITRHTAWPKPLGTYDSQRKTLTPKPPAATSAELFSALDTHLKKERRRFSDVFDQYDTDRSGKLERSELAELIRDLLGSKATASDIGFFQVQWVWGSTTSCLSLFPSCFPIQAILDLDGSSSVTQEEFLTAAKSYVELSKMASSAATAEVRDTLKQCSQRLAGDKVGEKHQRR